MRPLTNLLAAFLLAACAREADNTRDTAGTPGALADSATSAATISNAIAANPAAADSILRANGHTADTFERLLYDIAADSAMSARYASARTASR
jgi:hypothetical protein